jgi:hypothetical protein
MAAKRQKEVLLGVMLLILAIVLYRGFAGGAGTSTAGPAASNPSRATGKPAGNPVGAPTAPDVHLDALESERPAPAESERNLFRFKPKAAPPPPPSERPPAVATAPPGPPPPPPGPPPPPPIALKFIGIVEQPGTRMKIAILSDGQGPPLFGSEGGTVAGRYRVLRIGVESIELSYLDGRGRQTIRLTGG